MVLRRLLAIDSRRTHLSLRVAWLVAANEMLRHRRDLLFLSIFAIVLVIQAAAGRDAANCLCGYYDEAAGNIWTESIIAYFNETTATPIPTFIGESYSHKYEKGWNTQFRIGADIANINFSNITSSPRSYSSLDLYVSPYTSEHLVIGSSLRTSRRDIQYGSFTCLLRSPAKFAGGGGSVLSFAIEYNSSQSFSINLQNTDMPSTASISTLVNEESPAANQISYDNVTDGSFGHDTGSPWDYKEYRLDWTRDEAKSFIGGILARSVTRSQNKELLSVPSLLNLRHWSNGLATGSQGPPTQPTVANAGWVRFFFNSSLMTEHDHASFDSRCRTSIACPMNDMTLRGSSTYPEESTKEWRQAPMSRSKRIIAIWLAVACISLTTFLLLGPIWTRLRERLNSAKEIKTAPEAHKDSMPIAHSRAQSPAGLAIDFTPRNQTAHSSNTSITLVGTNRSSPTAASFNPSRSSTASEKRDSSRTFRRRSAYPVNQYSSEEESHAECQNDSEQRFWNERFPPEVLSSVKGANRATSIDHIDLADSRVGNQKECVLKSSPTNEPTTTKDRRISWNDIGWKVVGKSADRAPSTKSPKAPEIDADRPAAGFDAEINTREAFSSLLDGQQRIEYLAGLLVVSCLLVTAINFNLTFVYGDLVPDKFSHSRSEEVARKTIIPFLLNPMWIGPFLLTSARFLITSYLRTGDLLAIAERTVKRTFRFMLPATAMLMLEYFFSECGATKWLEYLPSITWSTWPFIEGYSNFGNFLSELLELIYLIPNAEPVITYKYCTHVLWSIPVQLQGSWTTLLAVIVVREIQTPWKRFGFYAFCIVNHWYALSWGSYFYAGIMLTDLNITYKWQPYLHARSFIYYPLLLLCISFAFAGPTLDLLNQRTGIEYSAYEYSIHPNVSSGLPISEGGPAVSPVYFIPRLNGLVFAIGLQSAVELSPAIQKMLSTHLFMIIFPHIFTIYLLHGFIFWTLGPWLCIFLAVRGLSYWSNILIVALCCYTVLALTTPVITIVFDCLAKTITTDIWRQAREDPVPRHPTLYPFPKDLFLNRYEISWERTASKDGTPDEQERRVSRAIPRVRKPSKDLRTSWHERQSSGDSGTVLPEGVAMRPIPRDRKPSKDLRTSLYENTPQTSPRTSWYEADPPAASRAPRQDQEPSVDPRTSWHERKASKVAKLDRVEDVEEEPEA